MDRKLTFACLVLVASLTLGVTAAIAGTARGGSDPGVTPNSILLGGTAPLTGPSAQYAAIARGADAYFKYLNARGGINGRKITYRSSTTHRSPPQSLPLTRELVEQEKVFAVFNSFGTAQNLAVRPYLNGMKVPQLLVASGATTLGRDYAQYPYTIGLQPSYQAEGWVYGKYLARTAPVPRSRSCSRTTTSARTCSAGSGAASSGRLRRWSPPSPTKRTRWTSRRRWRS